MTLSHELELKVDTVVSGTLLTIMRNLQRISNIWGKDCKVRSQRLDMLNRNRQQHAFEIGQIVYMYQGRGSMVQTGSRKVACFFVGRLKPGTIWTSKSNVTTLVELRQALSTGLKIQAKQDSHISSDV